MPAPRIDKATVERMLLAYITDPNPTHVARICDVSWQTAKKYIQEGAPLLGIGPFASEARRLLRAGDKMVRLTEVTKEVRVQIEAKDLGAMQDMMFEFENLVHDGIRMVRARMSREQTYFDKVDKARDSGAPEEVIKKMAKPAQAHVHDVKNIAVALQALDALKRQFWDRMEIVQRTEVEITSRVEEGVVDTSPPPVDFERWTPQEIADYVDSIEAGDDPVYPAWMAEQAALGPPKPDDSADPIPNPNPASSPSTAGDLKFPPGAIDPT